MALDQDPLPITAKVNQACGLTQPPLSGPMSIWPLSDPAGSLGFSPIPVGNRQLPGLIGRRGRVEASPRSGESVLGFFFFFYVLGFLEDSGSLNLAG